MSRPELPHLSIHECIHEGRVDAVEKLRLDGADVNEPDIHGDTPLICAARMPNGRIMEALFEAGARVSIDYVNAHGVTALYTACDCAKYANATRLIEAVCPSTVWPLYGPSTDPL